MDVDHYLLATACMPYQSFVYVQQIKLLHPLLPKILEGRIKNGFFFKESKSHIVNDWASVENKENRLLDPLRSNIGFSNYKIVISSKGSN